MKVLNIRKDNIIIILFTAVFILSIFIEIENVSRRTMAFVSLESIFAIGLLILQKIIPIRIVTIAVIFVLHYVVYIGKNSIFSVYSNIISLLPILINFTTVLCFLGRLWGFNFSKTPSVSIYKTIKDEIILERAKSEQINYINKQKELKKSEAYLTEDSTEGPPESSSDTVHTSTDAEGIMKKLSKERGLFNTRHLKCMACNLVEKECECAFKEIEDLPTIPKEILAVCSICRMIISECVCSDVIKELKDHLEKVREEEKLKKAYFKNPSILPICFSERIKNNDTNHMENAFESYTNLKYVDKMISEGTGRNVIKEIEKTLRKKPFSRIYVSEKQYHETAHSMLTTARIGTCKKKSILQKIDLALSKELYSALDTVWLGSKGLDFEFSDLIYDIMVDLIHLLNIKGIQVLENSPFKVTPNNLAAFLSILIRIHKESEYHDIFDGTCLDGIYNDTLPETDWFIDLELINESEYTNPSDEPVDPIHSTDPKNMFKFLNTKYWGKYLPDTRHTVQYFPIQMECSIQFINSIICELFTLVDIINGESDGFDYGLSEEKKEEIICLKNIFYGLSLKLDNKLIPSIKNLSLLRDDDFDMDEVRELIISIRPYPEKCIYLFERMIIMKLYSFLSVASLYSYRKVLHIDSILFKAAYVMLDLQNGNFLSLVRRLEHNVSTALTGNNISPEEIDLFKFSEEKKKRLESTNAFYDDVFDCVGVLVPPLSKKYEIVTNPSLMCFKTVIRHIEDTKKKSTKSHWIYNIYPRILDEHMQFNEIPIDSLGECFNQIIEMYMDVYMNKLNIYKNYVIFLSKLSKYCPITKRIRPIKFYSEKALSNLSSLKKEIYSSTRPAPIVVSNRPIRATA